MYVSHMLFSFILFVDWRFSSGTPVSSTNKTDRHDIHVAEILLKVALNTINHNSFVCLFLFFTVTHLLWKTCTILFINPFLVWNYWTIWNKIGWNVHEMMQKLDFFFVPIGKFKMDATDRSCQSLWSCIVLINNVLILFYSNWWLGWYWEQLYFLLTCTS
jgi:hypothetical protein